MFDVAVAPGIEHLPVDDLVVDGEEGWWVENLPVDDQGMPFLPSDDAVQVVPEDLDSWGPGPRLAAVLSTVDVSRLSDYDRVVVLRACHRLAAHVQAQVYAAMDGVADSYRNLDDQVEWVEEAAALEVGSALRLTRRAATSELGLASDLTRRLPAVGEALSQGRIDRPRAVVLSRETLHLPEETARMVVDQLIDRAGEWTTGQLSERIRRLCVQVDPDQAKQRFERTVTERRVTAESTPNGTAHLLGLDLPPDQVAAAAERIDRIARTLKTTDETRTIDQLRADVYLDLLTGRHHQTKGGTVHVTIDAATLAELSDHPGELAGMGPVIADIASQAADQARTWTWAVTHPDTGQPLATGITRRRPHPATRRHIHARTPTCIAPGCRTPAIRCDLDHRIPYSHRGATHPCNLAPLCRHHHQIRHHTHWTYTPTPDGDHHWTSPLGHTYTTSGRPP